MRSGTVAENVVEAGWREASGGVVSLPDAGGSTLRTRYPGRLPEAGRTDLKMRASHEVFHWMERNRGLEPAVAADGAKDSRTFPDAFHPEVAVPDFRHAAQHLKAAADAAFGPDSVDGIARSGNWHHIPRHDPKGVDRMIDALRYLLRKGRGCNEIKARVHHLYSQ